MSLRLDDINMRENTIRLNLQMIDNYLLRLDDQSARNAHMLLQLQQAAGIQRSSPPTWENLESQKQQLRGGGERATPPHRAYTPPHRPPYNEDRLRPFTDYHAGGRARPPLQHGMSVDRSEFEQRFGATIGGGSGNFQVRRSSVSQSEEAVQSTKKAGDSHSELGNPEHHRDHNAPGDVPDGAILPPPRYSRSLSIGPGRSGSPRTLSLRSSSLVPPVVMPFTPIVTPTRLEYTSITDAIDTSCIEHPANYRLLFISVCQLM